jgi:hypothetical protein
VAERQDDLSQVAIAAALAVASGEGLRVVEPRVVGRGSNRIIWLWPAPIVARVMTGTAVLHVDPGAWLAREIDVGTFLAGAGAAVVAPASDVDPGPHVSGGLWLSFWEHVDVIPADVSAGEAGRALRVLHDALAGYSGELPPRSAVLVEIDWLLVALTEQAGIAALREERERLAPMLRRVDAEGQPLHGDASFSNLLATSAGPRCNDFEDVCFGSPAWDVVGLWDDACKRNGQAFAADLLAGYGHHVDPTLRDLVRDGQDLYGSLWQQYRQMISTAQA